MDVCLCVCVLVEVCVEGFGGLGRVEGSLNAFHVCGLHTHTHTRATVDSNDDFFSFFPKLLRAICSRRLFAWRAITRDLDSGC